MVVVRLVGAALVLLGLAALGWDILGWDIARSGEPHLSAAGEWWYALSPGTLNLAQAVIQRHILPQLWDPVMIQILLWPAALVLMVPGVALLLLSRRPRRRRTRTLRCW